MFHHAVELFLWLLLAFALGAILGCLVRAAFGRGKEEMEYRLTGPRLSDAYKAEGGKGTPVGRALGLMGSGEESSTAKAAGLAAAATAGAMAKTADADTSGAAEKTAEEKAEEKAEDEKAAGAPGKSATGEKTTKTTDEEAAAKKSSAQKASEDKPEEKAGATEAQGLVGDMGEAADAEDKEKWNVPLHGLDKPTAGEPDNLQIISGIGPKLEQVLHSLGIYYFAQIARWTKKDIAEVDDKLKFKGRIERDEWVRQAKLLAEGKMEQFEREYGTGGLKDKSGKTRSGTRTRKK